MLMMNRGFWVQFSSS